MEEEDDDDDDDMTPHVVKEVNIIEQR